MMNYFSINSVDKQWNDCYNSEKQREDNRMTGFTAGKNNRNQQQLIVNFGSGLFVLCS